MVRVAHYSQFHMLTILSVAASVIMTRWRTRIRRQMNERDIVGLNSEHEAVGLIQLHLRLHVESIPTV